MVVTITMTNYYRYRALVDILPPAGPYVAYAGNTINDSEGNNNGQLDCSESPYFTIALRNVGTEQAENAVATLRCPDTLVQIIDSLESYGNIPPGDTLIVTDGYLLSTSLYLPEGHELNFEIETTDGIHTWTDYFSVIGHAPIPYLEGYFIDDLSGNGNGVIDPAETVDLEVYIANEGSVFIDSCVGMLSTTDPYLQILLDSAMFGDILPGDTSTGYFQVHADPSTPLMHSATLYLEIITGNSLPMLDSIGIVIGQKLALVLDPDPNTTSGPSIVTALETSGLPPEYSTSFPSNLSDYQVVFCCLGVYPDNHVLSTSEGQLLADFLNSGGNLYMEGADTWAYDPQTPVHSMFNIIGLSDGSGDMGVLSGIPGSFADGINMSYDGENSWMDRLDAASPAAAVLENNSPAYITCIAHNEGSYMTIGTSHEFGGLVEGGNTRAELMARYLQFFDITVTCEWQGTTGDWHDPENWSNGIVPDASTNVVIPYDPVSPYPTQFSSGHAHCRKLDIEPGANLIIPQGITITITQ
jgi:hypothetical protein